MAAPNQSIPSLPDTRRQTVHELPASGPTHWTLPLIADAIDQHQLGQFRPAALLHRSMMLDESYAAAINKRVNTLLRAKRTIVPSDPNDPMAQAIADDVADRFDNIFGVLELQRFVQWFLGVGDSTATLDWVVNDGRLQPRLRSLNAEFSYYIPYERTWYFIAQSPGVVTVTPGDGRWVKLTEWSQGTSAGFVDSLSNNWFTKQLTKAQWQEFNDSHAWPIIKAKYPDNVDGDAAQSFISSILVARRNRVIGVPCKSDGTAIHDIELLFGPTNVHDAFKQLIDYCDRKFQVAIQGGNLSTEIGQSGGNRAAATIHHDVELELVSADAEKLNACLRDQVLQRYVDHNYGPWHRAPNIVWDTNVPEDVVQKTTALVNFSTFCKSLKDAGISVDNLAEVASKLGLELSEGTPSPSEASPSETAPESGDADDNSDSLAASPSSAEVLAQRMTDAGLERCEHGNPNRCRSCGIERERSFELGPDGAATWAVKWVPVSASSPSSRASAALSKTESP